MGRERLNTTIDSEIKKMIQFESIEQNIKNNELLEYIFWDYYKKSKAQRKEIIENSKAHFLKGGEIAK